MKKFFGSIWTKLGIALLIVAGLAFGGYEYWYYQKPKFQGTSIELGEELPEIGEFLTEYAKPDKVRMVTGKDDIDLKLVGEQDIVFVQGNKEETVKLTITDTTAPKVSLKDVYATINDDIKPEDFIDSIEDYSETSVEFTEPLKKPDSYSNVSVELKVTDKYGNETKATGNVFYVWMYKEHILELGTELTKEDLLLDPERDAELLSQEQLDVINGSPVGEYRIVSRDGRQSCDCTVKVVDTTPPELELNKVKVYVGEAVRKSAFVKSTEDISGEVTTTIVTKTDTSKAGTYTIKVEAKDASGNVTTKETTLEVVKDTVPPKFSGLKELSVKKNSTPDYRKGVSAKDEKDGNVDFSYDAGNVDTGKAGTYYVTYTATDKAGNKASQKRKIIVNHDKADTDELVASIASGLSSSPEAIRNYVKNNVKYSSNWGGDDPIWYGFKNKSGNCYVHAQCFMAILRKKGIPCKLIWTTNKTHYWVMVQVGGSWKHMDATPSSLHGRYLYMNDAQRYETLSGRDWDRTAWPPCN
ncbi:MAG: transglutaminase domain-containing protein [Clostridia bacterium]|nr:transglutaminase domain-containing protein [Clostridia bacterium]